MRNTILIGILVCISSFWQSHAWGNPQKEKVIEIIHRVNNHWQTENPEPGWSFWEHAAYHTGNMEAYFLTGEEKYRAYSELWANKNQWMGAKEPDKSKWLYSYGERDQYVLFGDWQICFQTYIDLYNLDPEDYKIARAREVMEYQMSTDKDDYWWWADGLYMVMPVMTKMYNLTGNRLYLEKLHEYYTYAKSIMYDEDEKLFYRDAKYVYPKHKSANGLKDFWARGDGWVFAGLAKVLKDLPIDDPNREEYIRDYQNMAVVLKPLQQADGYWTRSMKDPEHAPGPETSGTAFFTYGYLWGMNNGYLSVEEYAPVVEKSWKYLTETALQVNGKIGYVQPIGERAIPGQVVDANSTANFGVGAFLLASCEMVRYLEPKQCNTDIRSGEIWLDNTGVHVNAHGGGILYKDGVYYWFGEHKSDKTSAALKGVTCYSSTDLINWRNEGIALSVEPEGSGSDIEKGCVLERPKVIYNEKDDKYVMWFHLELKGKGYEAARVGLAVSDYPTGPYKYIHSYRPNAGYWPENTPEAHRTLAVSMADFGDKWWTPEWTKAVEEGLFVRRDFEGGQMSRDMTLYVDDDKKAYHIFSSEENLTLHIAELSDDYQSHTGRYIRIFPAGHNEAPAIFKKDGTYFMITSGCTGWAPNAARMFTAPSLWGPWEQHPNPCIGEDAELTFHSQSTYIQPVIGKEDTFIFMADRWRPRHPSDARYVWLPIQFENGLPVLKWVDAWKP